MVPDSTLRVETTGSITRIDAVLIAAGLLAVTFIVDDTLWSAVGRRANVASVTGAHGAVSEGFARGVGPTWGWDARVRGFRRGSYCC